MPIGIWVWWWHPTISSSATLLFCLQSFPAWGSLRMSRLFPSGGQSIGALASDLPMNTEGWFPLRLTLRSPCCPRDSQESSPAPQFKSINFLALSLLCPTLTSVHDYWKNRSFDYKDFVCKVMSLLFTRLSRFVIAFLPRSKSLLKYILPERIHLPVQKKWVWSPMWEDPTCHRATKPTHHNYWSLCAREAVLSQQEKPLQWEARATQLERGPCSPKLEKSQCSSKDPAQLKINKYKIFKIH